MQKPDEKLPTIVAASFSGTLAASFLLFLVADILASPTLLFWWWTFLILYAGVNFVIGVAGFDSTSPAPTVGRVCFVLCGVTLSLMFTIRLISNHARPKSGPTELVGQLKQAKKELRDKENEYRAREQYWRDEVTRLEKDADRMQPHVEQRVTGVDGASQLLGDMKASLYRISEELQQRIRPAISRLTTDRDHLKQRLLSLGITDSGDLAGSHEAGVLAREFAETVRYLNALEQKNDAYGSAAFELGALVRRLERQQVVLKAGLPEEEIERLTVQLKTIDRQLDLGDGPLEELDPIIMQEIIDRGLREGDRLAR
jgi:membrane protein implicated in regulation of membrane protease activity